MKVRICAKKILWTALAVIWMVVIFRFSSQNGSESSELSGGLISRVAGLIVSGFSNMSESARFQFIDSFQTIVRKCAHMGVYAVLGVFVLDALRAWGLKAPYIAAIIICVLFAASDELHQYFVPGRSAMISDVFIDTMGIAAGLFIYWFIARLWSKRQIRHTQ